MKNFSFKKNNKFFKKGLFQIILFIIIIYSLFLRRKNDKILFIEVDISKVKNIGFGPIILQKSINKVLPYKTSNCQFIPRDGISPTSRKKKVDYFFFSLPSASKSIYKKWKKYCRANSLLLGPNFVPIKWFEFPMIKYWQERNFREILQSIKGLIVHSNRIRDHLANKSNNTDLLNKFIIFRPCTDIKPNNITSFDNRHIDIILYEKYSDSIRTDQGNQLFNLFNNAHLKIKRIFYGNYTKKDALYLANDSKFIIYFSFYDTGAIALKEIQNYGVLSFSHQIDLVISNKTSYYIPELEYEDMKPAFNKIMNYIEKISKSTPNTLSIAKINQDLSKCEKALDDLCEGINKKIY